MAKMPVDTKLIRELADMLNDTDLSEIKVENGELKIKLSRGNSAFHMAPAPTMTVEPTTAKLADAEETNNNPSDHPGTVFHLWLEQFTPPQIQNLQLLSK